MSRNHRKKLNDCFPKIPDSHVSQDLIPKLENKSNFKSNLEVDDNHTFFFAILVFRFLTILDHQEGWYLLHFNPSNL